MWEEPPYTDNDVDSESDEDWVPELEDFESLREEVSGYSKTAYSFDV